MVSLLAFSAWCGVRIHAANEFNAEIKDPLEIAATTNSLDVAREELGIAITEIEARGLTEGRTWPSSVNNDVELWYTALKDLQGNLEGLGENPSQHEVNVALLLVRTTILQDGEVSHPQDVSVVNHPAEVFLAGLTPLYYWCGFGVLFLIGYILRNEEKKRQPSSST